MNCEAADKKPFIPVTTFDSEHKVSIALTENQSRINHFKILMRSDLSTLSKALEKSIFTAQEILFANCSEVIIFFFFVLL